MDKEEFERVVAEALDKVPVRFAERLKNVAILIEDGSPRGRLLGLYQGVPQTARGDGYGVGMTLPDTIKLYRETILAHAEQTGKPVAEVVQETVWHEIAHYFGMDEGAVHHREEEGTNHYGV